MSKIDNLVEIRSKNSKNSTNYVQSKIWNNLNTVKVFKNIFKSDNVFIPPLAFMPISDPITLRMRIKSSTTAPSNEKPVEVFIKSAPLSTAISEAIFFY